MKDYAKKSATKPAISHFLAWLLVTCLCALMVFVGWALYRQYHPAAPTATPAAPHKNKKKHVKSISKNTVRRTKTAHQQPTFDFYSMLTSNPSQITASPHKPRAMRYYLQLSVTSSKAGAEKLATRLGTEGYATIIKNQPDRQTMLFKVLLGPYSTLTEAKYNQMQLNALNNKAIIIKTGHPGA